jgi:hypothetical protein
MTPLHTACFSIFFFFCVCRLDIEGGSTALHTTRLYIATNGAVRVIFSRTQGEKRMRKAVEEAEDVFLRAIIESKIEAKDN